MEGTRGALVFVAMWRAIGTGTTSNGLDAQLLTNLNTHDWACFGAQANTSDARNPLFRSDGRVHNGLAGLARIQASTATELTRCAVLA